MRHTIVGVFIVALLSFSTGCLSAGPSQRFVVRQGSELATLTALVALEATAEDATNAKTIAIHIQLALDEDGIDPQTIKQLALDAIIQAFENPQQRLIALTLVDTIAELIIESLNSGGPLDIDTKSEVVVLVRAAVKGVEAGADLYLASLNNGEVRAMFLGSVELDPAFDAEVIE